MRLYGRRGLVDLGVGNWRWRQADNKNCCQVAYLRATSVPIRLTMRRLLCDR